MFVIQSPKTSVGNSRAECSNQFLSPIGAFKPLRELDIEENIKITSALSGRLVAHSSVVIAHHAFALHHFDGAWAWDLVDGDNQCPFIQSCKFDWAALQSIVQSQLVSKNQIVTIFALKKRCVRVRLTSDLLERDIQVG